MRSAASRAGSVSESAPGKVNLGLAVLTRRGDGYHEMETLFAKLDLADEVTVTLLPGEPGEVRLTVVAEPYPGAPEWFERSVTDLPASDGNLVVRAARAYLAALAEAMGEPPPGAELRLVKRLPVAAGLGLRGVLMSGSGPTCFGVAGSSDAAEELAAELRSRRPELWVQAAVAG
jgi:4-diphosphocytidyl-2-C-methyl-D-erythritol kinase